MGGYELLILVVVAAVLGASLVLAGIVVGCRIARGLSPLELPTFLKPAEPPPPATPSAEPPPRRL